MDATFSRTPYPSDVSDEEWVFLALYLTRMREDAPQRTYPLRELIRIGAGCSPEPGAVILDSRRLQSTLESGARTGWDGAKRKRAPKSIWRSAH